MATLTIHLEDDIARSVEESARREHKSVSEWVRERVALFAAMEARAIANGYPAAWLSLFGSLADDDTFVAPKRSEARPAESPDGD